MINLMEFTLAVVDIAVVCSDNTLCARDSKGLTPPRADTLRVTYLVLLWVLVNIPSRRTVV